jgi:hypothetical protein
VLSNVISANGGSGVLISGVGVTGNVLKGNMIGMNAGGAAALPSRSHGVRIGEGAATNTVGGTAAADRNVISANASDGVLITGVGSKGNFVLGNFVGLDAAGAIDLGNDFGGVLINGGANNVVGGTVAGARNVISGNGADGVLLFAINSTGNQVLGNFIGTNAAGSATIANGSDGVEIAAGAANNTVGGTVALARNVISGNGSNGVKIQGVGATGNKVVGNFIGTDAAGAGDLGNTDDGLEINAGAANNTVGGTVALARNVISGNGGNGVLISGSGTTANTVQGDFIGVAANGTTALGNGQSGVFVAELAAGNAVGGTAPGAGNVIANNGGDGVLIGSKPGFTAAGAGNSVQGNSIFANGDLGIDLGPDDGLTLNDANDIDSGPNNLLNKPVLTDAFLVGDVLLVSGTINTELGKSLRIELFSSPAASAGQAEGQTFLGFVQVSTAAANTVVFSTFIQNGLLRPGQFITATATDELGNTSEFSLAVAVV